MTGKTRPPRIDYMPGDAAMQAIEAAERMEPRLSRPAVIDKLVIYGLWLMQHPTPQLPGADRYRWNLPAGSGRHAGPATGAPRSPEVWPSVFRSGLVDRGD